MSELLPKDIQVEIFLKLPLNSILACKCVCKSWRQFLCNPEFVKNHLNRSIQTNKRKVMVSSYHPFMLYSSDYASISKSSSQSFSWDGSVAINFPFYNYGSRFEILGSCNGLICLLVSDSRRNFENNVICIWNPSTRERTKVPVSGSELYSAIYSPYATRYGFGYDCVRDEYKLVRINNNKSCSRSEIHVYRLRLDKWYRTGTRQTRRRYSFPSERKSDGLLFNGALHWLGVIRVTFTEVIVSFNVISDKMVDMPLPVVPPNPEAKQYKNLGVLEDCLCLVFVVPRVSTDVWVMKDYKLRDSWTKQFSIIQNAIDFSFWKPILVFQNGDILADTTWQSVVCDPEQGNIRKVCNSSLDGTTVMDSASYVESLVSPKSRDYVLKNNKKRRWTTHYEEDMQIVETQGMDKEGAIVNACDKGSSKMAKHFEDTSALVQNLKKKKKRSKENQETLSVKENQEGIKMDLNRQPVMEGTSSSSSASVPPGFANHNRSHAFEEDEEVSTSQSGLEDTEISFSKLISLEPILVKRKKMKSRSQETGMFPSGTLSTKKKTSQKPKVPNRISTTKLVEFGSQWGSPCGGTSSRRV